MPQNPPVFPTEERCVSKPNGDNLTFTRKFIPAQDGMSLRDYFAGQALVNMLAHLSHKSPKDVAVWAYEFADAMLKEREQSST